MSTPKRIVLRNSAIMGESAGRAYKKSKKVERGRGKKREMRREREEREKRKKRKKRKDIAKCVQRVDKNSKIKLIVTSSCFIASRIILSSTFNIF